MRFDDITWLILGALQQDARISYKELAERVGLTPPAIADRIRKLEKAGVIDGFEVRLNPEKLGLPITAVIRMNTTGEAGRELDAAVGDIPEVLECHRVTGAESHVIRARVASTAHLEEVLTKLGEYGQTVTNIVTSSAVPRRGLKLPPALGS